MEGGCDECQSCVHFGSRLALPKILTLTLPQIWGYWTQLLAPRFVKTWGQASWYCTGVFIVLLHITNLSSFASKVHACCGRVVAYSMSVYFQCTRQPGWTVSKWWNIFTCQTMSNSTTLVSDSHPQQEKQISYFRATQPIWIERSVWQTGFISVDKLNWNYGPDLLWQLYHLFWSIRKLLFNFDNFGSLGPWPG